MSVTYRYNTRSVTKAYNRTKQNNQLYQHLINNSSTTPSTPSSTTSSTTTNPTLRNGCICGKCVAEPLKKPLGPPPGFENIIPKEPVKIITIPTNTTIPANNTTSANTTIPANNTTPANIYYNNTKLPGLDIPQSLAYQAKQSNVYIKHYLDACEKTKDIKNKKVIVANIFNHLLANHALLILYPRFRKTVLNKVDEIENECKKRREELKKHELNNELNNLENKINNRLINDDYSYRVKGFIKDIMNTIELAHKDLVNDTLPGLCVAVRNLIKDVIPTHPNYIA